MDETSATYPTEAEVNDFIDKLTHFRASLSPLHQSMLEELTAAALGPAMAKEDSAEVQAYTAVEFPIFIAWIPILIQNHTSKGQASPTEHDWLTARYPK